jgi:cytochrome c553
MGRMALLASAVIFVAVAFACSSPPPAEQAPAPAAPAESLAQHMTEHFTKVREIEQAVIRGDLEAATPAAQWILEHKEAQGLPAGTQKFVTELRNSALGVTSTDSVGNAAVATAAMVTACGNCHAAAGVTPTVPEAPAPELGTDTASHMRAHQYAVDLMYEGLIVPSAEKWAQGAEALKVAPLASADLPADVPQNVAAAEARVHELADRAITAQDNGAKIAIYGEIIGSCASCHGLHGKVWGPGVPKAG